MELNRYSKGAVSLRTHEAQLKKLELELKTTRDERDKLSLQMKQVMHLMNSDDPNELITRLTILNKELEVL